MEYWKKHRLQLAKRLKSHSPKDKKVRFNLDGDSQWNLEKM